MTRHGAQAIGQDGAMTEQPHAPARRRRHRRGRQPPSRAGWRAPSASPWASLAPSRWLAGRHAGLFLRSRVGDGADRPALVDRRGDRRGDAARRPGARCSTQGADETLSHEEQARRERMREGGAGITSYATDKAVRAGRLRPVVAAVRGRPRSPAGSRELPGGGPGHRPPTVPRREPGGLRRQRRPARRQHARRLTPGPRRAGRPRRHLGARRVRRQRGARAATAGHWWLPDGSGLLVARVDESPVGTWWVADPAHPETEPYAHRYPAAGTPNADVSLHHVGLDGTRHELRARTTRPFPYLVTVVVERRAGRRSSCSWTGTSSTSRCWRHAQGATEALPAAARASCATPAWVDVIPGSPQWWGERLLTVEVSEDTYRLCLDGQAPSHPIGLQVRAVGDVDGRRGPRHRRPSTRSRAGSCWSARTAARRTSGPTGAQVTGARDRGHHAAARRDPRQRRGRRSR